VAHACNPRYFGRWRYKDFSLRPASTDKKSVRPCLKNKAGMEEYELTPATQEAKVVGSQSKASPDKSVRHYLKNTKTKRDWDGSNDRVPA
jgi:hypothetical protein